MSKPARMSSEDWMGDENEPLHGFSWKHGYSADTKGILFWPDVFLYDAPNGEKIAIIIMDTQGLFELNSTQEENAKIFGLSTLISSIQIINLSGVMQENQIEYLEMATSLTKFIAQKKFGNSNWKPFQRLLFLVRDWADENIEGGFGYAGGETYFKTFLNTEKCSGTKAQSIRKNIRGSFDKIECFLLGHPSLNVAKKDFKGEWGKLESSFVQNLKVLIESILKPENLIKKSILGKHVTGSVFRDLIHTYLKMFDGAKLPEPIDICQMTIENQMSAIVAKQISFYQKTLISDIDFNHRDFKKYIDDKHKIAKDKAVVQFLQSINFDDEKTVNKFQKILQQNINENLKKFSYSILKEQQEFIKLKEKIEELKREKLLKKIRVDELENFVQKEKLKKKNLHEEIKEKTQKQENENKNLQDEIEKLNFFLKLQSDQAEKMEQDLTQNFSKVLEENSRIHSENWHEMNEKYLDLHCRIWFSDFIEFLVEIFPIIFDEKKWAVTL